GYVNVHGGGFVVGHPEQDDPWCRYLAAHAKVAVVNTDYVLAPHRRFPVPVEQIHDVLQWASSPDREWDGTRLCVGGQSGGGNLAAGAARLALENGGARDRPPMCAARPPRPPPGDPTLRHCPASRQRSS